MNNSLMNCRWKLDAERLKTFAVENRLTGQTLDLLDGGLPQVVLGGGCVLAVASAPMRRDADSLAATFHDDGSGLAVHWSATLDAAARWARANRDVLVDTHWIGGNPGVGEVYGWASWRPGKGIVVLRNPSDRPQAFSLTLAVALELPATVAAPVTLRPVYPREQVLPAGTVNVEQPIEIGLGSFAVVVLEVDTP